MVYNGTGGIATVDLPPQFPPLFSVLVPSLKTDSFLIKVMVSRQLLSQEVVAMIGLTIV